MFRSHGEPASVFKQRNNMNKMGFKALFFNRGLLNKPGAGEVQKEGSK